MKQTSNSKCVIYSWCCAVHSGNKPLALELLCSLKILVQTTIFDYLGQLLNSFELTWIFFFLSSSFYLRLKISWKILFLFNSMADITRLLLVWGPVILQYNCATEWMLWLGGGLLSAMAPTPYICPWVRHSSILSAVPPVIQSQAVRWVERSGLSSWIKD